MMRDRVIALLLLIGAGVILAGCTAPAAQPSPAATTPATIAAPVTTTAVPQFSFTLGPEYLHKKYSFTSESETFSEQFRVTNDPWAIDFTVNPTNTDPQYTWFEITATNTDSGRSETFGYGSSYPLDKYQQHPMYNAGPYRFDLKGNRVSVEVIIAKRNP
jgi:hypothetical protein